jgi:metal-sulfur cluster biosynthetic enzyme
MFTEAALLDALRDCYDPVLRRNIVELGLVRSATLTPDSEAPGAGIPGAPPRFIAHIALTAASSDEAANLQLSAQVQNRLAGIPAISSSEVHLSPSPFPILR